MTSERTDIAQLEGGERELLPDLVALLADAVDDGASVGFLAPLDAEAAGAYFARALDDVAAGSKLMWVARDGEGVVASVQLALPAQPNAAHRGEVQRLLVHRRARRRGLGTRLMRALERDARAIGRTLLVLNTRAGDPPERLYERLGYVAIGVIPGFARNPDGTLNDTTIMYRQL